jgi:hypothetical protein
MAEIISTGAALVGGAAWFADKLFGPSAEALGGSLKVHLQARIPNIFSVAERKASPANLHPVAPGLLSRMIVDASFSEENEEVTDWWANLFIQAASGHCETNRQAVFSDIMAMLGPTEVRVLKDLVDYYRLQIGHLTPADRSQARAAGMLLQERLLESIIRKFPLEGDAVEDVHKHLADPKIPLPVRTSAWALPEKTDAGTIWSLTTERWFISNQLEIEILERARVFRFVRVDVPLMGKFDSWIDLVGLTELGIQFFEVCSGEPLEGKP